MSDEDKKKKEDHEHLVSHPEAHTPTPLGLQAQTPLGSAIQNIPQGPPGRQALGGAPQGEQGALPSAGADQDGGILSKLKGFFSDPRLLTSIAAFGSGFAGQGPEFQRNLLAKRKQAQAEENERLKQARLDREEERVAITHERTEQQAFTAEGRAIAKAGREAELFTPQLAGAEFNVRQLELAVTSEEREQAKLGLKDAVRGRFAGLDPDQFDAVSLEDLYTPEVIDKLGKQGALGIVEELKAEQLLDSLDVRIKETQLDQLGEVQIAIPELLQQSATDAQGNPMTHITATKATMAAVMAGLTGAETAIHHRRAADINARANLLEAEGKADFLTAAAYSEFSLRVQSLFPDDPTGNMHRTVEFMRTYSSLLAGDGLPPGPTQTPDTDLPAMLAEVLNMSHLQREAFIKVSETRQEGEDTPKINATQAEYLREGTKGMDKVQKRFALQDQQIFYLNFIKFIDFISGGAVAPL